MSSCETATALVPAPEGYEADLCNPERRADIATYWCFGGGMILSLLFTAQRLYVKLGVRTGWQVDDTILAIAWIASLVVQICIVYGFANGFLGVHSWEVSMSMYNEFLLDLYISAPIYIFAGSCAKTALSIFYLRLSPQRWFRYSIFAIMLFIAGYSMGIFFALIFACTPVAKSYDYRVTEGSCISTASLYIATAVFNIASDLILFILPIPMVVGLQMRRKQKFGLLFIFGIGSATIVTSIMRAVVLPTLLTSTDPSWDVAYASMLVVVESNLIIICGTLPTLRKFVRHVAPKLIGEGSSSYAQHGQASKSFGGGGGHYKQSSHSAPGAAAIVTFGSLPSTHQKNGGLGHHHNSHRGYAKFDEYAFALETIGGTHMYHPAAAHSRNKEQEPQQQLFLGSGVVGVFRSGSKKGRVDTTVVAGGGGVDVEADGHHASSGGGGVVGMGGGVSGRNSMGSRESQMPIMGGGGGGGAEAGAGHSGATGITATTRIEVSYDRAG